MQIISLHKNVYKLYAHARPQETLAAPGRKHRQRVERWESLKKEGLGDAACGRLAGFSRASYYRSRAALSKLQRGIAPPSRARKRQNKPRWGETEKQLVLRLRRENPTYGQDKLAVILARDHQVTLSPRTVGRILAKLRDKGLITASPSRFRVKRRRNFRNGHAVRWSFKKYKEMALGERVQIDHMTATKNGVRIKHFQAWERTSRHIHTGAYGDATARSATRFLTGFVAAAPYKIQSIQVDGGSEFRAEFEEACAGLGIPLIVLPPAKPKYNGGVERGNRTFREEFYDRPMLADSLGAIRAELKKATEKYNAYRPHFALDGRTPNQYLNQTLREAA
jgi:transposase InsO family protein